MWCGSRRGRADASISPAAIAVAGVALFLLSNKVYSPTYDLWLLPGFVLLPFRPRWWLVFCAVDVGIFVTVYGFFHGIVGITVVDAVLPVLVLFRTVILIRVLAAATRKRPVVTAIRPSSMTDAVLTTA